VTSRLEGAEHPGHLFVLFHQADQEVVGAGVLVFVHGDFGVGAQAADHGLVVGEQYGEHALGVGGVAGLLL